MQGRPHRWIPLLEGRAQSSTDYTWYGVMREYHPWKKHHCPVLDPPDRSLLAILDGQQRLTNLNIGLRGSHPQKKKKYERWRNLDAYSTRFLYL